MLQQSKNCVLNTVIVPSGLSNSMDVEFCVEALKDALAKHGKPELLNTDSHMMITSSWVV